MQNQIPKNWQKVKLGDLFKVKHGYAFKGEYFSDKGKYVLLTPGNFSEKEGLKFNKVKYYTGQIPPEYMLHKGDLLVVMTDVLQTAPYLGAPGIVDHDNLYLHNQRLGLVTDIDNKKTSKEFLYWLFQTNNIRHQIKGSASGSTVKHTAPERIYSCEAVIPESVDLQKQIAVILSAFDDKIEVNNKIAKTLEEMAQALFKEWFVHFRFPGYEKAEFVDSELGKIPKGWTVQNIGDICETFGGGTPSTNNETYWQDGTINWATPTDMTSLTGPFIFDTEKKITDKGLKNSSTRLLPIDSILITSRATVGILAISKIPICTNQGFITVVCSDYPSHYFMFSLMKNRLGQIRSLATGSTFPEISRGVFRKISVILPDKDIVLKFDQTVKPIFEKIANIMQENQKLVALRDLLLPKLMKGAVRIK